MKEPLKIDLSKSEKNLTKAVQASATKHGWDKEVVSKLKVKVEDNKIKSVFPPELTEKVHDLEFGHQHTPPRPVFRILDKDTQAVINEAASKEIIDLLLKWFR